MKKLIIVLGICLLGFGCDKVENDDDQIRQNEINRQFIGLWKYAVPHDKNTEPYYGFTVNFKYTSFLLMLHSGDKLPSTYDGKPYHFEKGPECSKGTVYTLVLDNRLKEFICKYNGLLYMWWQENSDPDKYVGNPDYAYERN